MDFDLRMLRYFDTFKEIISMDKSKVESVIRHRLSGKFEIDYTVGCWGLTHPLCENILRIAIESGFMWSDGTKSIKLTNSPGLYFNLVNKEITTSVFRAHRESRLPITCFDYSFEKHGVKDNVLYRYYSRDGSQKHIIDITDLFDLENDDFTDDDTIDLT